MKVASTDVRKTYVFQVLLIFSITLVVFNIFYGISFVMKTVAVLKPLGRLPEIRRNVIAFNDSKKVTISNEISRKLNETENVVLESHDSFNETELVVESNEPKSANEPSSLNATVHNTSNTQSSLNNQTQNFGETISLNFTSLTNVSDAGSPNKPKTLNKLRKSDSDENNRVELDKAKNDSNELTHLNQSEEASQQQPLEAVKSNTQFFDSTDFWNIENKPVLANGHVGFVPYGDSIYMNGLFNGAKDESHRARIPNYANIQFEPCSRKSFTSDDASCFYALDIHNAVFSTATTLENDTFTIEHIQYAHRFYESVIVVLIRLQRNQNDNSENSE